MKTPTGATVWRFPRGTKLTACLLTFFAVLGNFAFINTAFATAHSAGANVSSAGTVYMVTDDGYLRPYTSAGAFLSYSYNSWSKVSPASAEDLALPKGNFIPPRDGKIICSDRGSDKGTCYLMTNAMPAGFVSEKIFKDLGFSFANNLKGDVSFLSHDANIESSAEQHRLGTAIKQNGNLFIVGSGGLFSAPSLEVLKTWGYTSDDIVMANTADGGLNQISVLPSRTGSRLSLNGSSATVPAPPSVSVNVKKSTVQDYINAYPDLPTATTTSSVDAAAIIDLVNKIGAIPNLLDDTLSISLAATIQPPKFTAAGFDLSDQFRKQKTEVVPGVKFDQIYPYLTSESLEMLSSDGTFKAAWEKPAMHLFAMNNWGSSIQIFQNSNTALYIESKKQIQTRYIYPYSWVCKKENGVWKLDLVGTLKYRNKIGQIDTSSLHSVVTSGHTNIGFMTATYTDGPTVNDRDTWLQLKLTNGGADTIRKFHLQVAINGAVVLDENEPFEIVHSQSAWFAVPISNYWTQSGVTKSPGVYTTEARLSFDDGTVDEYPTDNVLSLKTTFAPNYSN